ncbi:serine/threonine protein kinase [Mycobacterium nebraskense]|uniref:non-specific serine/threonine protein kinase n=1 Tax=Mycobacterium nebraskense TaxID=244292 RepID=A0A0F5NGK5_9MYCO|nr:serine/threonine-protein kinase PknD [Mycobacterium nebraskense]KKC05338.1 serine/threonine protein kinase [Mycobacterium nebraskense]KLO46169.1 serine/threonine protein kinase [Mycobacterium nebraskense]MCV7120539.1 protein kinase [Mycobacterium nebraskense]ORW35869.1 serine/threonine protein kinase [Mycobacterium nebraskense]
MPSSEPGSRTGSFFGPYRLMRLLGRGGMGEVYEAEDTRKHRVVALKLISEQFSADPVLRERMHREADAAGRLTEQHVVPIHDYGEIDGQLYLDMRLIDGVSLRSVLTRDGPLAPARAVAIARQVAAALDAAHASGVTHRDVKPENILITGDDFAYLVDFGIARAASDPGLTHTGMVMGTYNYMAPERFTSGEVTYRSDIYSLACVLAECLIGSPPYRANSIERAVGAHLTEPAPRPSQLRPETVPVALDQVIARGMAKNPEERYRSAGELATAAYDALTAAEQGQAAAIPQRGDNATLPTNAAGAGLASPDAVTQARAWSRMSSSPTTESGWTPPVASTGSWRSRPSTPPSVSPAGAPDFRQSPRAAAEPHHKRKRILVGATALLVILAIGVAGYLLTRGPHPSRSASGQTVLPLAGLGFPFSPGGVALDNTGNVYVTSQGMYGRVVKLAAGSGTPTVLPFTGLYQPQGLAVDANGTVYVADFNNRVVKLDPGSSTPAVLPFNGLNFPQGVAVDAAGNLYVADRGNNRVVKLETRSNTQTDLPFTGLNHPDGVAVDAAGTVYVTDSDNDRVLKLHSGSSTPTLLPFTGLTVPSGIAVDTAGAVYVTDHESGKVVKLDPGSSNLTVLPFTGNHPVGVAVNTAVKKVLIADNGTGQVVELAAS